MHVASVGIDLAQSVVVRKISSGPLKYRFRPKSKTFASSGTFRDRSRPESARSRCSRASDRGVLLLIIIDCWLRCRLLPGILVVKSAQNGPGDDRHFHRLESTVWAGLHRMDRSSIGDARS